MKGVVESPDLKGTSFISRTVDRQYSRRVLVTHDLIRTLAKQYVYRWIDGILELLLDLRRRRLIFWRSKR
jgi:hypothetical protein